MKKRLVLSRRISALVPVVVYMLVIGAVFGRALIPPPGQIIFGPDIFRYHYYQKPFLTSALSEGQIPWWNPYTFGGQPYMEHPQIAPWYPVNWLFAALPISVAFSLHFAVHLLIAMVGMYYLCRIWTGKIAAWIAGVAFGLSGFFVGRIYAGHVDLIAASAWTPLVVALFWQAMQRFTKIAVVKAGASLAILIFAGYQTIALFTVEAVALAAVLVSVQKKSLRPLVTAIVSSIIGLGLAAVQLLPNMQFVGRSIRTFSLPQAWAQTATPTLAHLLELIDYSWFYEYIPKIPLGHEHGFYIGKVPLLAALTVVLWAIHRKVRRVEIWFLFLLSILALWIGLGHNAPIDLFSLMRKFIPVYSQIRIPPRHFLLFVLGASALAGIGIGRIRMRGATQLVIATLVLVDLVPFAKLNINLGPLPTTTEDRELVAFLKNDVSVFRILPNFFHGDSPRESLEFNAPMTHRIFSASGYDQPPLRNYYEFLMAVNDVDTRDILSYIETIPPYRNLDSPYTNALNIKYILVPTPYDPLIRASGGRFHLVKEDIKRGYRLYENPAVLPRFYLVPDIRVLPDRQAVTELIRQGSVDPASSVLVEKQNIGDVIPDPTCGSSPTIGSMTVTSYTPNRIELRTKTQCNSYLTSSEVMYPGWVASIDGKKTVLFEGNLAFRTLYLPQGDHTVVLRYIPWAVLWGALGTAGSVTVCAFWLVKTRRK